MRKKAFLLPTTNKFVSFDFLAGRREDYVRIPPKESKGNRNLLVEVKEIFI